MEARPDTLCPYTTLVGSCGERPILATLRCESRLAGRWDTPRPSRGRLTVLLRSSPPGWLPQGRPRPAAVRAPCERQVFHPFFKKSATPECGARPGGEREPGQIGRAHV